MIEMDDGASGVPVTPAIGRFRFDEAAKDLLNDYRTNRKRSIDEVARRIDKHLEPFFGGRRMAAISTVDSFLLRLHGEAVSTGGRWRAVRRGLLQRKRPDCARLRSAHTRHWARLTGDTLGGSRIA